jgi:peptidyl-tRNA hydrolase
MIVFYGLGNHEAQYLQTKHNVGRLVLEKLAEQFGLKWMKQGSFFWRLKIGIRPELNRAKSETFVLSRISSLDEATIERLAKTLGQHLDKFEHKDLNKLQTLLHTKPV